MVQHLPHVEHAVIDELKITNYLLSVEHPFGRAKARFFHRFGFGLEDWETLRNALLEHAQNNAIASREVTTFGMKYIIEGTLVTADNRNPLVRAVWFVESGQEYPRFVTAYPQRKENSHDS